MGLSRMLRSALIASLLAISASAQSTLAPVASPPSSASANQFASPSQLLYFGSTASETLHPGVFDLSLPQALDRGLKTNLGLFLSSTASDRSRAARWRAMSELLPHLDASIRETMQRINLRALGIPLQTLPRTVDVSNSDAQLQFSQSLLDLAAISRTRSANFSERAAHSDYRDARETVAAVISATYLTVLSAQSRLDLAQADLKTAEALYRLARNRESSGLNPEVDTLRAKVELQSRQENVIDSSNALAKQRIALLRLLGLDIHQSIHLTSSFSDASLPAISSQAALEQALDCRADYRSTQQQLRAAESAKQAAEMERAPTVNALGNYGALGTAPANAVAVWNVGVVLRLPVFEGGRIKADVTEADAVLREKRAELQEFRDRIAQEVENALLDVASATKQVEVSQAALGYANRALTQSRDRFSAGVTNNIEVIQAQEALASANDRWINSLYAYTIARVSLARATGSAETGARSLLTESPAHN